MQRISLMPSFAPWSKSRCLMTSRMGFLRMKTLLAALFFLTSLEAQEKEYPLVPYTKTSVKGVDTRTLQGKVMAGYQGWFNTPQDGANLGWTHWARAGSKPFAPGNVTVDLWPDMTEYSNEERYATGFQHADGKTAEVFSSHNRATVERHFQWMRDYGIDGAFVQRFANGLKAETLRHVLYVSCDLATQVRDLAILRDAGFVLTEVQPFDLFPHTRHVENIMTFDGPA